ncbi:acyltransferase [Pedobacter namyangjuensis]|uniref:acyltransferase n=1 Tax=Pedobacter namyangjuensis TaxID=600626 RepID=UPI000DE2406B|nr:acyltransferase [Pedobacter namyangjuensis]
MGLKEKIKANNKLKQFSLWLLMPPNDARPRWWIRNIINPFTVTKGKQVIIRNRARLDILPFNKFVLGDKAIVEDFSVINNGVGDVNIGDRTIIGLSSVVIGPVNIGNDVMLAQHVVISGLNHGYEDTSIPPSQQATSKKTVNIMDNVWIGANAVITAGVTINKHCIVGAGSVVTKDVPAYCVVVGNPAKVIKQYNEMSNTWEKVNSKNETNQ